MQLPNSLARQLAQDAAGSPTPLLPLPTSMSLAHDLPHLLAQSTPPFLSMSPCSNLGREYRRQAEREELHQGVLARHGLLYSVQVAKEVLLGMWVGLISWDFKISVIQP